MQDLGETLDSREVSEMIEKEHSKLMRDIRRYAEQLAEAKIGLGDFFRENQYTDANNQIRPCYKITLKGCEFLAHKLTGTKGTIFTARYINRFHEMQDMILGKRQQESESEFPWFLKRFEGRYIVLERDFAKITGVDIRKHKLFYRMEYFRGGVDYNGWGWKCNNEEFKEKYGFEYGEEPCLIYLHPSGVKKGLKILENDRKVKMNADAKEILLNGLETIEKPKIIAKQETKRIEVPEIGNKSIQIIVNVSKDVQIV